MVVYSFEVPSALQSGDMLGMVPFHDKRAGIGTTQHLVADFAQNPHLSVESAHLASLAVYRLLCEVDIEQSLIGAKIEGVSVDERRISGAEMIHIVAAQEIADRGVEHHIVDAVVEPEPDVFVVVEH